MSRSFSKLNQKNTMMPTIGHRTFSATALQFLGYLQLTFDAPRMMNTTAKRKQANVVEYYGSTDRSRQ